MNGASKIGLKILKITGWIIASILLLFITVLICIRIPAVQNYIVGKVTAYAEKKTGTTISVGNIYIGFPSTVILKEVFLDDLEKDTLVYAQEISAGLGLYGLIKGDISLGDVHVENAVANLSKSSIDSTFNFNFLITAFAGKKSDQPADTAAKPVNISADEISLNNVVFRYRDELSGLSFKSHIGDAIVPMNEFILDSLKFDAGELVINNSSFDMIQSKNTPPDTTTESILPEFIVEKISATNFNFKLYNVVDSTNINLQFGELNVVKGGFSLKTNAIVAENVETKQTSFRLKNNKKILVEDKAQEKPEFDLGKIIPFAIDIKKFKISESFFALQERDTIPTKTFDPANMVLSISSMHAENVYHKEGEAQVNFIQASVSDHSGMELKKLKGDFKTGHTATTVTGLELATLNSTINGNLSVRYDDMQMLFDDPGKTLVDVRFRNSVISVKDILAFNEALATNDIIRKNRERKVKVNLDASGVIGNIDINNLSITTSNSTSVKLAGTVRGLPDASRLFMNLEAKHIITTAADVNAMVPIPETVNLPENMSLAGNFTGSMTSFRYNLTGGTNRGSLIASGTVFNLDTNYPGYTLEAKVNRLDLKYILKNEMLGNVNVIADINGKGFDIETMDTDFKISSDSISLNNYTYSQITLNGKISEGVIFTQAAVKDTNINLELAGSVGLVKEKEFYKLRIDLQGMDLEALKMTDHETRAKGTGIIDIEGNRMNVMKGNISITDVLIIKKGKSYPIETLAVININDKKSVSVESSLLTAQFDGTISIDETAKQLGYFFNNYFSTDTLPIPDESKNQFFSFSVVVKNAPVISEVFVPGLDSFIPGPISGSFNSSESKLSLVVQLPQIIYSGVQIDSLNIVVDSDKEKLNMVAGLNRLSIGSIELARTDVVLSASDNKIMAGIIIASSEKIKLKMQAVITMGNGNGIYRFALLEQKIILNDEPWVVPADNYVETGGALPVFHNFSLTNNNQSILIDRPRKGEGIGIVFTSFNLGIISAIIERDSSFVDGTLNGHLDLIRESEGQGIIAEVKLDKFTYKGIEVGDFELEASSQGKARYQLALKMTGNGNDLTAEGTYKADSTGGSMDADIDINRLAMKSLEPFTNGQITRAKGNLNGNFEISGPVSLPKIKGALNFDEVGFDVRYLHNYFTIKDEEVRIDQEGIYFDTFTINDTLNQKAVINGRIDMTDVSNPSFFIDLKTDRFLAMDTHADDNNLFYGTLKISSNIKMRGDKNLPVITSNVKLLEGSSFTFVVPENQELTERGEQDVNFTDPYNRINSIIKRESVADTFKAEITGFDITSNIEITKETTLRILVDQESGDSLVIKGDATMSFSIDPSGKTSLTGGFEINEGSYRVSLQNLVKRNFVITKGSSINWRGDIMDAEINIDAVNVVNAVPLELVSDQVAGLNETDLARYRQRLPFQVILHMDGELMKPEISFEIALRPEDQGVLDGTVYAKLTLLNQDPSELNKQVFALLVLNRFVQENPLNNSGGGVAYVARNSVSKFLSQQLNVFAEQFIKGVELDFDVQSYEEYSSGSAEGRTEVNIGARKRFFRNRLVVQVSGNVDVEGERTKQNDASNLAGDIVLEYMITQDGRYRLRVFRNDTYAGVLDGEVKETGMGLLYTRDFDNWNDLFRKPEKKPEIEQL